MPIKRERKKNITIALPLIMIDGLTHLQSIGMIPSRSEGIRLAIYEGLCKELHLKKSLEELN